MNAFEKRLKKSLLEITNNKPQAFAPSIQVSVIYRGKKLGNVSLGKKATYFDLASLTKIIFTVTTVMHAVESDKLKLNAPIKKYLPWFPSRKTKVKELLSHSGGLPWWLPLYKKIKQKGDWQSRRAEILKHLRKIKIGRAGKVVYSDVDFWVLGFILESIYKTDLLTLWHSQKAAFGETQIHFAVNNKAPFPRSLYAPTEKCPWRHKVLKAEVHDDNAWAFGGVSTHAGLFGALEDVEKYVQFLRKAYRKKSNATFFRRQNKDWALGFMMPSKKGSSAGEYFSKKSIGHTGFTGTSIWYDPQKDLAVIILSNRVNPTRLNIKIRTLRPLLHDAVFNLISL